MIVQTFPNEQRMSSGSDLNAWCAALNTLGAEPALPTDFPIEQRVFQGSILNMIGSAINKLASWSESIRPICANTA
jgi:hypothetical protein